MAKKLWGTATWCSVEVGVGWHNGGQCVNWPLNEAYCFSEDEREIANGGGEEENHQQCQSRQSAWKNDEEEGGGGGRGEAHWANLLHSKQSCRDVALRKGHGGIGCKPWSFLLQDSVSWPDWSAYGNYSLVYFFIHVYGNYKFYVFWFGSLGLLLGCCWIWNWFFFFLNLFIFWLFSENLAYFQLHWNFPSRHLSCICHERHIFSILMIMKFPLGTRISFRG